MDELNWVYDGQQYVLETGHGKAIVVETPDPTKARVIGADKNKYIPRLELNDGKVREPSHFRHFDDFETAEAYLLFHELAPLDTDDQLSETLQKCVTLLTSSSSSSFHIQRLRFVAEKLNLNVPSAMQRIDVKELEPRKLNLNWQRSEVLFFTDTPYGMATISEKLGTKNRYERGANGYETSIIDSTGVKLQGPRFYTFEAAEEWILAKLRELDHPVGGKMDVENIIFTLEICIKLLPEDGDPSHYWRIKSFQGDYSNIVL